MRRDSAITLFASCSNLRPVVPLAQGNCNVLLFGNLMVQERDANGERFMQIRTLLGFTACSTDLSSNPKGVSSHLSSHPSPPLPPLLPSQQLPLFPLKDDLALLAPQHDWQGRALVMECATSRHRAPAAPCSCRRHRRRRRCRTAAAAATVAAVVTLTHRPAFVI